MTLRLKWSSFSGAIMRQRHYEGFVARISNCASDPKKAARPERAQTVHPRPLTQRREHRASRFDPGLTV